MKTAISFSFKISGLEQLSGNRDRISNAFRRAHHVAARADARARLSQLTHRLT